jgi:hypothetical protein
LPTPTARDYKDGAEAVERGGEIQTDTVARAIFSSGEIVLPTPTTNGNDRKGPNYASAGILQELEIANGILPKEYKSWDHAREKVKWAEPIEGQTKNGLDSETNWGKFEPAIRRWESALGRVAPAPTKPDGKDSAHRLSSEFTEWLMGLPQNWICNNGLSRNDELKMCGNGVVPQQAVLALRILLDLPIETVETKGKLFATPNTLDSLPPREGEAYEKVKSAGGRKNRESSGNLREQVVYVIPAGGGSNVANPNS